MMVGISVTNQSWEERPVEDEDDDEYEDDFAAPRQYPTDETLALRGSIKEYLALA